MLKFVNLKENNLPADVALAMIEIEIENAKNEGVTVIKALHGYGSHGKGGTICVQLRKMLAQMKKSGKICDFFGGDEWNLFSRRTTFALNRDKSIANDEDLNKSNPGITIIVL